MKVLIADKFEKVGIDGLKDLGCTVVAEPDVKAGISTVCVWLGIFIA